MSAVCVYHALLRACDAGVYGSSSCNEGTICLLGGWGCTMWTDTPALRAPPRLRTGGSRLTPRFPASSAERQGNDGKRKNPRHIYSLSRCHWREASIRLAADRDRSLAELDPRLVVIVDDMRADVLLLIHSLTLLRVAEVSQLRPSLCDR